MIIPLGHKWILTPHSWCEPGNQKDWPIRGVHSVYRIFNFDDIDIEKRIWYMIKSLGGLFLLFKVNFN